MLVRPERSGGLEGGETGWMRGMAGPQMVRGLEPVKLRAGVNGAGRSQQCVVRQQGTAAGRDVEGSALLASAKATDH